MRRGVFEPNDTDRRNNPALFGGTVSDSCDALPFFIPQPSNFKWLNVKKRESDGSEARGRGGLGPVGNSARAVALFAWTATAPQPLTLKVAVQKLCVRPRSFSFCRDRQLKV